MILEFEEDIGTGELREDGGSVTRGMHETAQTFTCL